ncbi:MAG: diguanylate cyclase [Lachnospiraceae bacterium]|nr:diguanylate cyclase [Lachnospiraceae bacterium]
MANKVNEVLQYPLIDRFEKDLDAFLNSEAAGSPIVLALFDIDEFMRVNDNWGMDMGDKIIIESAQYVAGCLPEDTVIYRIGGDEFAIIFNNGMEKEDVFLLMNDIKNGYPIKLPDGSPLTISAGIATAFEDATRLQELIRKAESALFRAKNNGRNKVGLAREEKMVPKTSHYTSEQLSLLSKLAKREGVGEAILLREALDMLLKKYDTALFSHAMLDTGKQS